MASKRSKDSPNMSPEGGGSPDRPSNSKAKKGNFKKPAAAADQAKTSRSTAAIREVHPIGPSATLVGNSVIFRISCQFFVAKSENLIK